LTISAFREFLGVHGLEGHLFDNLAPSAGEWTGGWRPPINVAERAAAEQADEHGVGWRRDLEDVDEQRLLVLQVQDGIADHRW